MHCVEIFAFSQKNAALMERLSGTRVSILSQNGRFCEYDFRITSMYLEICT